MSEQVVQSEDADGGQDDEPFVMVDGRKVRIYVVDYGLIPPWDGFSLSRWWSDSKWSPTNWVKPTR